MANVAVVTIATNRYIEFIPALYESVKKNFLVGHNVDFYCQTNRDDVPDCGVLWLYTDHEPWPAPTLKRYHKILDYAGYLVVYDYIYYLDADMLVVGKVGDEILGEIVATVHPGFFWQPRPNWPYECDDESVAYMKRKTGDKYYAGGFNGGSRYLDMALGIRNMVDADAAKGIVAVWHDESYLNKWLWHNKPTVVLPPEYCCPDDYNTNDYWRLVGCDAKILALSKDHEAYRV